MFEDDDSVEAAEPTSGSASTSASISPIPVDVGASPARSDAGPANRVRRKPIPKKGHTKSRRGCQACKRRKVKCQENLPECTNCQRLGLSCIYNPSGLQLALTASPSPSTPLRTAPASFSMADLRYFHHFLVTAFPPLPMGGDAVWQAVAALSHQYDYLVHAMLGLAASHLNLYTADSAEHALAHRVKAIQLLNESLNTPCASTAEGDARFGTIMALTFQSSCMPEGMNEFLSMVRGCHVVAATGTLHYEQSLFREFTSEGYTQSVKRLVGDRGVAMDPDQEALFDEFLVSLRRLAPLCKSKLETEFLAATERVANMVKVSTVDTFTQFTLQYDMINAASQDDFTYFTNPINYAGQIILIHFILIEFAIGEIAMIGRIGERFGFRRRAALAWLDGFLNDLPEEYYIHVQWPLKYATVMMTGLTSPYHLSNIRPDPSTVFGRPPSTSIHQRPHQIGHTNA
ncbi:hypothetical protein QBC39DRAFT_304895 [Podospora conica]|nr:hypothetical protein QBC39DRAFT_304895 [Schizothecium conicum]